MGREVAQAMRCQLLTGSYEGGTRCCECISPSQCKLSGEQRERLYDNPYVKIAREKNAKEFMQIKGVRNDPANQDTQLPNP